MRASRWVVGAGALILLCLAVVPSASAADVRFGDGGWSWFQDPRAITHTGLHTRTYVGWVTPAGDVTVGSYDHGTQQTQSFVLHAALQRDDHVSPALQVRPDGRIVAYYAAHSGTPFYYRVTTNPEDVTEWGPAQTIDTNTPGRFGYTYPNPIRLAAERRTYLFWRGGNLDPVFSTQEDGETEWAPARSLIRVPGESAAQNERPYLKFASRGEDTVHFAYTNAHPNEAADVNVYYGRIRDGKVEEANGAFISDLGNPIGPREADKVFDGAGPTWIHDVAVGTDGRPVLVFASFPAAGSTTGHVYHYARWTGESWEVHTITAAGGSISPGRSPLYSGGITLDHDDPSTVYLSRQVGTAFWVETWKTPDGGRAWSSTTLTPGSTVENVRPLSPRGNEPGGEMVIWMSGTYTRYTDFATSVTTFADLPAPPMPEAPVPPTAPVPPIVSTEPKPGSEPPAADRRRARASLVSRRVAIGPRRGGRLVIRCRARTRDRCRVSGTLRRGRGRIGSVRGTVRGGRRGTLRVRLTRRAAERLRRTRRMGARVVAGSTSLSGRRTRVGGTVRLRVRRAP